MNGTHPPALALRLMEEAGTEPAVIGDLIETYSQRRDAKWFWRQAIAASAPSPMNAVRWAVAIPLAWWISLRLSTLIARPLVRLLGFGSAGFGSAVGVAPVMFVFSAALVLMAYVQRDFVEPGTAVTVAEGIRAAVSALPFLPRQV